jgi:hypothetical protein
MSIFADFENFITTKAWPFLRNIGKATVTAEITALTPIATTLAAEAQTDIVTAAASGSLSNLGAVLGALVTKTAAQAEAQAITAGATSLLASVGTALATNTTTATSLTPAAPVAAVQGS